MSATVNVTYVVGSAFTSSNRHIFLSTTGGSAGGSEPSWNQSSGGTTSDGSIVWTECSVLFRSSTFTNTEPSGGAYGREPVTNNSTNWPAATGTDPSVISNGTTISFTTSSSSWGNVAGFLISDASTSGNYWAWGLLNNLVSVGSAGVTFQFTPSNLAFNLY